MDPFVKNASRSRKILVSLAIGGALIAGVLVIGWIAMGYTSYKQSGGVPPGDTAQAQAAISNPQNGAQIEIGEFVMVQVDAIGPNAFTSIELWLDGALAGVQMAQEGGTQPFIAHFSWQTLSLGQHSLIASAVDSQGNKVFSPQVVVSVVQGNTEIELLSRDQTGLPAVEPAPPEGTFAPGSGPEVEESTGPAEGWQGSPENWVTSLRAGQKPNAPTLLVRPMGCGANLLIRDQSNNEEGFVVYRQLANSPIWMKLDTLSSQSEVDWIEYADNPISGIVTYYVSSFNSQGESQSNLTQVKIGPSDCPAEMESSLVESINMTLNLPQAGAEKIYCYQSTDGVNWVRWPVTGFLAPDAAGNLPLGPIAAQIVYSSSVNQRLKPPGLYMDCWGWQSGELSRLGGFSVLELEPDPSGKQVVAGEGISAEVEFNSNEIKDLAGIIPTQINLTGAVQALIPSNMPASPDIPRAILSVTSDRFKCIQHLPYTVPGGSDQLEYCYRYPAYDPEYGNEIPQPYLVWDFDPEPVCIGGASEDCKTYQELLGLAGENGGQVGFTITSLRDGVKNVWNVTEPNQTMFVVPPIPCIGETMFNVRMWYRPGKEGLVVAASPDNQASVMDEAKISMPKTYYGPFSNWVSVPCNSASLLDPSVIEMVQYYDITFEKMGLSSLDDDDHLGTEVVELYGYFFVISPSMSYQVELPCYFQGFGNCDDNEKFYMSAGSSRLLLLDYWETDNGQDFIDGVYALEDERLCRSTVKRSCKYAGQNTYFKYYNNTLRVYRYLDYFLAFGVRLYDYDEASYDDIVCYYYSRVWGDEYLPSGTYTFTSSETDSGNCWLRVRVNKLGDPVPIGSIPDLD